MWRLSAPAPPASRPRSSRDEPIPRDRSCCSKARRSPAPRFSSAAAPAATSRTPSSPNAISGAGERRSCAASCARFRSAKRSRFFASSAFTCTKKPGGKLFPEQQPRPGRARCAARETRAGQASRCVPAIACSAVEPVAAAFRLTTSPVSFMRGQVVLATGGQSLPKSGSDGSRVRPRPPRLATRSCRRRRGSCRWFSTNRRSRCRRCIARSTGVSQDVEIDDLDRRGRRNAADGRAAVDPHRHQRSGRDERVAALAARAGSRTNRRSTVNFFPGVSFDERRSPVDCALAAERPGPSLQNALAAMVPGVGRCGADHRIWP